MFMIMDKPIMNIVQDKYEQRSQRPATLARKTELAARLIDLADAAIDAAGVQELRARALAEAAGCSVGAIYSVFPDLDELILTVNGRTLDRIDAALAAAVLGCTTPMQQMERLASAYLNYAVDHRGHWSALFQHRMIGERPLPGWYATRLDLAFRHIEGPLQVLRPDLDEASRVQLARTVFSAVHGVVELGLSGKALSGTPETIGDQVQILVSAIAHGLAWKNRELK
ncbi:TetR-like C-terminal domain-containing protein [Acidisoma silvae]|uniref:WHG domain-containing protein n=1 Tax=Acidisoma silvae TaxID=2802396 RepID=A0A963YVQ6_9PROT|nr:TetR-like C-terminal domain-containing protein [Acidisoma silvae]MCB8877986.1 WHG domain-containing protein [Acidisoma silvae]